MKKKPDVKVDAAKMVILKIRHKYYSIVVLKVFKWFFFHNITQHQGVTPLVPRILRMSIYSIILLLCTLDHPCRMNNTQLDVASDHSRGPYVRVCYTRLQTQVTAPETCSILLTTQEMKNPWIQVWL